MFKSKVQVHPRTNSLVYFWRELGDSTHFLRPNFRDGRKWSLPCLRYGGPEVDQVCREGRGNVIGALEFVLNFRHIKVQI